MNHLLEAALDLLRVNKAFVSNPDWRRRVRTSVLRDPQPAPSPPAPVTDEDGGSRSSAPVHPYAGLSSSSTAFLSSRFDAPSAHLNVVLPEISPGAVFAGVKTALEAAGALAVELSLPLRVVCIIPSPDGADDDALRSELREHLVTHHLAAVSAVTVVTARDLEHGTFGADDRWMVTHWTTAHAVDVACRESSIDRDRVVYLIQDYEPGFTPWSTDFALARSTYAAGFVPVVNSTHLARYLQDAEGEALATPYVFGPAFDLVELERSRAGRVGGPRPRVFFYGRPSKPRNLYALGVAALRVAAARLADAGRDVDFVMAGEPGDDVVLSDGAVMRNLGVLSRASYFELLSTVDVGLSLQYSPHPSHPPFDLALSGAVCVTNDFAGLRSGVHDRIVVASPDPARLADAIVDAVLALPADARREAVPLDADALGPPLRSVIRDLAAAPTAVV